MFPQQLQGRLVQHVGVDECSVQIDDKRRLHGEKDSLERAWHGGHEWNLGRSGVMVEALHAHCGGARTGQAAQEIWDQDMTVGQNQRMNGINERLFVSIVALSVHIVTRMAVCTYFAGALMTVRFLAISFVVYRIA